jgi:DNA-binding NtrC family response regulator
MATARARVLLAEDDQPLAAMLVDVLRDEGYDPVVARTQREALAALTRERFAVVLTDCLVPVGRGMDADAIAELARAAAGTPVVLCTGRAVAEAETVLAAVKGVGALVSKPFDLDDLLAAVRRAVDGR